MKNLLFFTLLALSSAAFPATHTFKNSSSCTLIAKNFTFAISASADLNSRIIIPDDLESSIVCQEQNGALVLQQTALLQKNTLPITLSLPTTCSIACWLTSNANVTISNAPGSLLTSLSLNLFNGGVATVINGTYASSNVVIHGLGFVEFNDVARKNPAKTYINGIGTVALISADGSFSFGGGMSMKNGARIGSGMNAGYRPAELPSFANISLEQLAGYAKGTKSHTELPNGWSNSLPGASFGRTTYDAKLKEIILNGEFTTTLEVPRSAPEIQKTASQNLPQDAPTQQPQRSFTPEQQSSSPTTSPHAEKLSTTKNIPARQFEQQLKITEEAQQEYEKQIRNLSFEEVKEILLSDKIYEGRLAKEPSFDNAAYSLNTQINAIEYALCTDKERESLWTLFLHRNFAIIDAITNEEEKILFMGDVHTPKTLFDALDTQNETNENPLKKKLLTILASGPTYPLFLLTSATYGIPILLLCKKMYGNPPIPFAVATISGALLGAGTTAWIKSCASNDTKNVRNTFKKNSKPRTLMAPDVVPVKLNKLMTFYFELLDTLATQAKTFPRHLREEADFFRKNLVATQYRYDNKARSSFKSDAFQDYRDIVLAYYNNLKQKAGI